MTRQPDWDIDRERGEKAEALVRALRTTLLTAECEVKCDDRAAETGNVYVETTCKTAQGWQPSGIHTTKATTWVWVLFDMRVIIWMPVWLLKNLARTAPERSCVVGSHPTRGSVLAIDRLLSESRAAANAYDQEQAA
jgi:hypothetical protein